MLVNKTMNTMEFQLKQKEASQVLNEEVVLEITEEVTSIAINVTTEQPVWITYMVYDVNHNLRAQYLHKNTPQPIVIHEKQKKGSPYTISGPIPAGKWLLDVSIISENKIMADTNWCTITVYYPDDVKSGQMDKLLWQDETKTTLQLAGFDRKRVVKQESRWYKGDFHTHTVYSDGDMSREENMISAQNQQLDFFVATDHNLVPTSWFGQTDILVMPGIEVTSPFGHFNILGPDTSPFQANRLKDMYDEEGMNRIVESNYGNALISINHPFLSKWKWLFKETPLDKIDTLEIWNDPTYSENPHATELALIAWDLLLNEGYKITGIGGSDSHMKPSDSYEGTDEPSVIGDPATFVYCECLSADRIVHGLKRGNVTVSRGERVQFQLDKYLPGENSLIREGYAKASIDTSEDIYFEWVIDGEIVEKSYMNTAEYEVDFTKDDDYHWIRVNARYKDGRLYGFSNPIYFGKKTPTWKTWGELLKCMKDLELE